MIRSTTGWQARAFSGLQYLTKNMDYNYNSNSSTILTLYCDAEYIINSYWVLVRTSLEAGAGVTRAVIQAENPHAAYQLFKGMYGDLLLSQFAMPVQ